MKVLNIFYNHQEWQVTAYATADEYNLPKLLKGLKEQGLYVQASDHKGMNSKSIEADVPVSGKSSFSTADSHSFNPSTPLGEMST